MKVVSRTGMWLLNEGSKAFSVMESNGVRVNLEYLDETSKKTASEIKRIEDGMRQDPNYKLWRKVFGEKTNLGSEQQLGHILYKELKYPIRQYTDKGNPKVDKENLDDIDLPIVQNYLKLDGLKTIRDNYLAATRREMITHDGHVWIHPFYNLHTASTFRSSANQINFQNLPKRNYELAQLIRPCFMPHPGHHMVEIDFSQIEVRIAAVYTKDPVLKKYILDPTTDMHRDTAMQLFFLNEEEYKKDKDYYKKTIRDSAKNQWVFPQFYGSTYFNCARNIWKAMKMRNFRIGDKPIFDHMKKKGVSKRGECVAGQESGEGTFEFHCGKIEKDFWQRRFKKYTAWKRNWFESYQRDGGFQMLSGFAVNGIYKRTQVCNYPIQGTAFHCLLWCIIRLHLWLTANRMKSKIIGEIHDSAILSVHPAELQDVLTKMHSLMTKEIIEEWNWIDVPLEAEVDVGPVDGHWTTCVPYVQKNGYWTAV